MVRTRSQCVAVRNAQEIANQTNIHSVRQKLYYASDEEHKQTFDKIRNFYGDDVSNVLGFWTENGTAYYNIASVPDYKILVRLVNYAGLDHPLMRAELHKHHNNYLNLLGVARYTRKSAEGDNVVHYRFKAGECV